MSKLLAWENGFNLIFEHHPEKEAIMEKILSDDKIPVNQMNNWLDEAKDFADCSKDKKLQEIITEPTPEGS